MRTKGYGFTPSDIGWSCPADLQPYADAYDMQKREEDTFAFIVGQYTLRAVRVAVDHSLHGSKAKSKYYEKPMLDLYEEEILSKKGDRKEYLGMTAEEKKKAETAKAIDYFNSLQARFKDK